jgi:hypothetical protein
MKQFFKTLTVSILVAASLFYFAGCDDDDDSGPKLTGDSKTYALSAVSNPAIAGSVTFANRDDNSTLITIELNGTTSGGSHPAHIHMNSAAEGGSIILDLTSVDGASGRSETVVTSLNDGTPITYEELTNIDGYVNVHTSASDLGTLIAQGDVGENELTGESELYTLNSVSNPAVSGTATFSERVNGETLVVIDLDGTTAGVTSPAHIHLNTAAQGGGIAIDLTSVNGATGISKTNVSQQNDGTAITYDQLLEFNGYLNVHESTANLATLIAQGDIGQNALTGTSKVYTLNAVSDPAISGTATFAERKNGLAQITLSLQGTTAGGNHPAHIHMNNATTGGGIVLDLANVNGATGKSVTNVTMLNAGTPITYSGLLTFNGYINVHLSPTSLATLIAQGNIGSNAP